MQTLHFSTKTAKTVVFKTTDLWQSRVHAIPQIPIDHPWPTMQRSPHE